MPRVATLTLVLFTLIAPHVALSQSESTFQVWLEEVAAVNIADGWTSQTFVTQYFVGGDREYSSISVAPSISYAVFPWLLAEGALFAEYVDQKTLSNVVEIRPYLALRYTDVIDRFEPYLMVRQEFRNLYYVDDESWVTRLRLRIRAGSRVAITDEYISPNSLYGIADVELFRNLDPAPREYFNARVRFHVGLGYRIGPLWSAEAHYMVQDSRSFAESPFDSRDNILRFTVRKAF